MLRGGLARVEWATSTGRPFYVKVLLPASGCACDTVKVGQTVGTTMWQSTARLARQSAILLGLAFGPGNLKAPYIGSGFQD
jgi:hypothetical protein